jgi:hypothetical protein
MIAAQPLPAVAAALLAVTASLAQAAWHDEHPGNGVRAHHVRLSGHSADNERARQYMHKERQACAEVNGALGRPVASLPVGGIPAILDRQDVDIYYTAGRTATVSAGRQYFLDPGNCGIEAVDHRTLRLFGDDVGASCTIDLIKRRADGACLPARGKGTRQDAAASPGVDLSKVPPYLRDDARRALEQISRQKRPAPVDSLPATGEFRTIAGFKCRVHRHASLPLEKCIAHPESAFPIPPASFHAGLPGILLYMTLGDRVPTITASEVRLDIGLSADAFAVPADIRVNSGAARER